MTTLRTDRPHRQAHGGRRWAIVAAAAGLVALLGGCVVYPGGYYVHPHAYWHGAYWR